MNPVIDYKVLEFGRVVAEGSHGIDISWIWGLEPRMVPMLIHVLPWADTMFNSSQVRSLVTELSGLPSDSALVPDIRDDLLSLCEITSGHRQLWFFGD